MGPEAGPSRFRKLLEEETGQRSVDREFKDGEKEATSPDLGRESECWRSAQTVSALAFIEESGLSEDTRSRKGRGAASWVLQSSLEKKRARGMGSRREGVRRLLQPECPLELLRNFRLRASDA